MKYNNAITNQLYDVLLPLVGAAMTDATILIQSKKVSKAPDTIQKEDLPSIAANIKRSLIVFLGTEGAEKVCSKIKNITI